MSTFQNAIASCDAAIHAINKLQEAKKDLADSETAFRLLIKEKATLEADVRSLKEEKADLEGEVVAMKIALTQLREEIDGSEEIQCADLSSATSSSARGFGEFDFDDGLASLGFFQEDDDRMSMHSTSTASSRKRRIAKAYSSPKKWRRMIRTNRLQSILLRDFY